MERGTPMPGKARIGMFVMVANKMQKVLALWYNYFHAFRIYA
jgi:hypothetical protein